MNTIMINFNSAGSKKNPFARLPKVSRDVIATLESRAEELTDLTRASRERWQEAVERKQHAEQQLKKLVDPIASGTYRGNRPLSSADPVVIERQKAVDEATAEFAAITERRDTLAFRRQHSQKILERASRWITNIPEDTPLMVFQGKSAKFNKRHNGDVAIAIEAVRERLAELQAEQQAVRSAPIPSEKAKELARKEIESLAEQGRPDLFGLIEHSESIQWPSLSFNAQVVGFAAGPDGSRLPLQAVAGLDTRGELSKPDGAAIVAWLFGDQLIEAVEGEIDRVSDDKNAIPDDARRERQSILKAAILTCEREEVELIESSNGSVMYRDDVDPRALLHLSSNLPGSENRS